MNRRFHRLVAALLLLAYMATGTQLLAGVMAIAAAVDGSHQVLVARTEGGVSLTLRHRAADFTPQVQDHSTAMAKVLVAFTKSTSSGDHHLTAKQLHEVLLPSENFGWDKLSDHTPVLNFQATLQHVIALTVWKTQAPVQPDFIAPVRPASQVERLTMVQLLV